MTVAGNVDVSSSNSIEIRENSTATFGGDLTINESKFNVKDNSTATIDGNLTLNNVEDTNVWNQVNGNSSLTVMVILI